MKKANGSEKDGSTGNGKSQPQKPAHEGTEGREKSLFLNFTPDQNQLLDLVCQWNRESQSEFVRDAVLYCLRPLANDMENFALGKTGNAEQQRWAKKFYANVKPGIFKQDHDGQPPLSKALSEQFSAALNMVEDDCDGLNSAKVRVAAILDIIANRLFDEFKGRNAPDAEMSIVNGLCFMADDVLNALTDSITKMVADVNLLRGEERKGA